MERKRKHQRWFFATDVHGSDRCYRKFLAAARVYEADVLLLGGDVAGKGIVPIIRETNERYRVTFQGVEETVSVSNVDAVIERIAFNGLYPYECTADEAAHLHDPVRREQVIEKLIEAQLRHWIELTEHRLDDRVRCLITPGNDDPQIVDSVLLTADRVECPERQLADIYGVALASLGNTNPTPWHTEREYSEDELREQIDAMLSDLDERQPLIFNFHCPPFGSGLDLAPQLDDTLRPVIRHGGVRDIPVGSTAVREAIEHYKPSIGLHGHIHESQGASRIGRTRCYNPGSDYASGVLKGLIVDLDAQGTLIDHLFTSG